MRWSMLKLHLEAAQTYAQVCFGGGILPSAPISRGFAL